MRAQREKTTFKCKDDCTLTKHTRRWTYSSKEKNWALCHIPGAAYCRFAEFFYQASVPWIWYPNSSPHASTKFGRPYTNWKETIFLQQTILIYFLAEDCGIVNHMKQLCIINVNIKCEWKLWILLILAFMVPNMVDIGVYVKNRQNLYQYWKRN